MAIPETSTSKLLIFEGMLEQLEQDAAEGRTKAQAKLSTFQDGYAALYKLDKFAAAVFVIDCAALYKSVPLNRSFVEELTKALGAEFVGAFKKAWTIKLEEQ